MRKAGLLIVLAIERTRVTSRNSPASIRLSNSCRTWASTWC